MSEAAIREHDVSRGLLSEHLEYVDDHGCRGYSIRFDDGCGTLPSVDASFPDASVSDASAAPDAGD